MEWVTKCVNMIALKRILKKKNVNLWKKKKQKTKLQKGETKKITVILYHLSHIYIRILQNISSESNREKNTWHEHWTLNKERQTKKRNEHISPLDSVHGTHIAYVNERSKHSRHILIHPVHHLNHHLSQCCLLILVYYFNGHYLESKSLTSPPMVRFHSIVENGLLWCVYMLSIMIGQPSAVFSSLFFFDVLLGVLCG